MRMTEHEIDMAQCWLNRMRRECSLILLRVANDDIEPDMTDRLKEYFNEPVANTRITSEVKNYLASVTVTDMRVLIGRRDLQNVLIQRMLLVVQTIRDHQWSIDEIPDQTDAVVSAAAV